MWNISGIVSEAKWKTSLIGSAGSLEVTLIKGELYGDRSFKYSPGDIIRFKAGSANVFHGYIFTIDSGGDEAVRIIAYDQLRYLMANDTYVFSNKTATDIIRCIAQDFNLQLGNLADTGYRIPKRVEDNKKLLDIINNALALTLISSGQNFVFYDDFGFLTLRNVSDMLIKDFYIGNNSLIYDFTHKRSIDTDTYNYVKIVQDNKKTGRRDVYVNYDSATMAKWGKLQFYQVADENLNAAQINANMARVLELKDRESRNIRIDAIGDIRVRAGSYVQVILEEFGISQPFLVEECAHTWQGSDHTMSLDLKVVNRL